MTNLKSIDAPSHSGQFGWERIGSGDFAIPVILRSSGVRYSPVRIVEQEIIKNYTAIPKSVFESITLKSYYMTPCEASLLNNINFNHCNNRYGDAFFTVKDVIISAADVKELSRFLNISHEVFTRDLSTVADNFGVIRLQIDPHNTSLTVLTPYITKCYRDKPMRFVPSRLIDTYVTKSETSVRAPMGDWDATYLKMLSIYCGNNSQDIIASDNQIVLLDGLLYKETNAPIKYEDFNAKG